MKKQKLSFKQAKKILSEKSFYLLVENVALSEFTSLKKAMKIVKKSFKFLFDKEGTFWAKAPHLKEAYTWTNETEAWTPKSEFKVLSKIVSLKEVEPKPVTCN